MLSLRERLLAAADQLLTAIMEGDDAVESFGGHWNTLLDDIDCAMSSSTIDDDTLTLVHAVSSQIAIIATSFQDIASATQTIQDSMSTELNDVLGNISFGDLEMEDVLEPVSADLLPSRLPAHEWHLQASREPSLVSDQTSDYSEEDTDEWPSPCLSGKRAFDDSFDEWDESDKVHKRSRLSCSTEFATPVLPGPAPTISVALDNDPLCGSHHKIKALPSRIQPDATLHRRRSFDDTASHPCKRRMSDEASYSPSKRPRTLRHEGKGRTASDPLWSSHQVNEPEEYIGESHDWVTDFRCIEPATFAPPDPSVSYELQVITDWYCREAWGSDEVVAKHGTDSLQSQHSSSQLARPRGGNAIAAAPADGDPHTSMPITHPYRLEEDGRPTTETEYRSVEESCPLLITESPTPDATSMASSPDRTILCHSLPSNDTPLDTSSESWFDQGGCDGERHRSRSQSPCASPPSFESATAYTCPTQDPPTYTVSDPYPQTVPYLPPPPYCFSPKKRSGYTYATPLVADALFAELLHLGFTEKSESSNASRRYTQAPMAGFAVAD